MTENVALQVQELCFSYPECGVLDHWSLALPPGLALVQGDESSGKTTLLRLLAGELVPQAGRILVHGTPLGEVLRAGAGDVFWADARSDAFHAQVARQWLAGLPAHHPQWDAAALSAHIEGFSLEPHLDKPFYALSTGSRRKVLMAGAFASGAGLTLIDEPVAGLDKPSVNHLVSALSDAARQTGRLYVVAHYEALPGVAWGHTVTLSR